MSSLTPRPRPASHRRARQRRRALTGPALGAAQRALEALLAAGLPSTRDENWKYANLRALEKLRFLPRQPRAGMPRPSPPRCCPATVPQFARYVFVDGVLAPGLSAAAGRLPPQRLALHDAHGGHA